MLTLAYFCTTLKWCVTRTIYNRKNSVVSVFVCLCVCFLGYSMSQQQRKHISGLLLVGCLMSQQHASVSYRRTYLRDGAAQTITQATTLKYKLQTLSQHNDTGQISPITDPGNWQGRHKGCKCSKSPVLHSRGLNF